MLQLKFDKPIRYQAQKLQSGMRDCDIPATQLSKTMFLINIFSISSSTIFFFNFFNW